MKRITNDKYKLFIAKFDMINNLNEKEKAILENLRFRDEDLSQKSGAILAFTGLMIATATVQLSSSHDSIIFIDSVNPILFLNKIGLVFLFISAFISLFGITLTGKYPNKTEEALTAFLDHIMKRYILVKYSVSIVGIGSILILISFLYALFL